MSNLKELIMPQDFDGNKYFELFGDYATSHKPGMLKVPEHITQEEIDACVVTLEDKVALKVDELWKAAHTYALKAVDTDARFKYLALLQDEATSLVAKTKIKEVYSWLDSIWQEYYTRKATIESGDLAASEDFSTMGNPPHSFWSIVFSAN